MNYDGKHFRMLSTSTGASGDVIFHYRQDGDAVWGAFDGDDLPAGAFIARADAAGTLDLRYAFIAEGAAGGGEIRTGTCISTPEQLPDGRIRLREDFQFTSGDRKTGLSVVEEVPAPDAQAWLGGQSKAPPPKSNINYDGRRFRSIANSPNGEASGATVFEYRQRGDALWGIYAGGAVRKGTLVAVVAADGALDMRYQHLNDRGELMTGECRSTPELLPDGRLRLRESWRWTSGDGSSGSSIVEEIK